MTPVGPKDARRIAAMLGAAPDLSKVVPRRCAGLESQYCGNPIELVPLPGGFRSDMWARGLCAECSRKDSERKRLERERKEQARVQAQLDQIPEFFRWADLSTALIPPGCRSPVVRADAIKRVRAWDGRILILRGESGTGKTTLAAARYRLEVGRGGTCAFVCCEDLSPDAENPAETLRRALAADLTVLDDLGADLSNAPAGGGLAAYRVERARRVIRERYRKGKRSIITTPLKGNEIAIAYGEDIERRLTEDVPGTLIIGLRRI